jgi:ABC-2 type transport system permease protein
MSERFTRTVAFFRKDLMEVLRQPRLVFTLVIGPFLILLAFGIGYDASRPTLETILVVPAGSGLEGRSEELAESLGQGIELVAVTNDESAARRQVADGAADLLVVVPPDAEEQVRANQQATIEIYHSQIDPFERAFVELAGNSAVEELNRAILREVVAEGQRESADIEEALPEARAAVDRMSAAVDRGDELSPADRLTLERSLIGLGVLASYRTGVVSGVGDSTGSEDTAAWEALTRAQDGSRQLRDPSATPAENRETLSQLSDDLAVMEEEVATFRDVDPRVLVSPFNAQIENASGIEVDFSHFYVPGVVALLLQHLSVTFAALSVVRERTLGSVELFRVSPLSAGETLTGKYLAYLVLGGLIAAILTVGAIYGFGFSVAGPWVWYAGVAFLVVLGSLGAGFVISAVVRTESEAIQYAMIMLLVSIFFSGFFIPIDRLIDPVRVISYLLPSTYGIEMLKQVAFLGRAPDPLLVAGATGYALVLLIAAWALMRRRVVAARLPVKRVRAGKPRPVVS